MRSLLILLVTFWLPAALAHHHHGMSLDPAASIATPHVAVAGDARATAVAPQAAAMHTTTQATTPAAQAAEPFNGEWLLALLILLAAGLGIRRLAKR